MPLVTVTGLTIAPVIKSVPLLTVVLPVYWLLPLKFSVPTPFLTRLMLGVAVPWSPPPSRQRPSKNPAEGQPRLPEYTVERLFPPTVRTGLPELAWSSRRYFRCLPANPTFGCSHPS